MANPPKIDSASPAKPVADTAPPEELTLAQQILRDDAMRAETSKQTLQENFTKNLRSDSNSKSSNYSVPENTTHTRDTQQAFGKKINVNPEAARQADESGLAQRATTDNRGDLPQNPKLQSKPQPDPPPPRDFSQVLQSRVFQGPLQNGSTQQKLQQQYLNIQNPNVAFSSADLAESLLSKGEILQLFSMRLRPDLGKDDREALRRLIKYEAALANATRDRVRQIQNQTGSDYRQQNVDALLQAEKAEHQDTHHRDLLDRLARGAESLFEKILQKVLGQGRSAVGDLPEGTNAELPVKASGEWEEFYARVTGLESALVSASAESEDVKEILFRGLMASDGKTKVISDLLLQENGEIANHKFAQLILSDPKLLSLLQTLKPGQKLPPEMLKALGEQILFLKLVNVVAGAQDLSEMEKQELLRKFRSEIGTGYQGALEKAMRDKRRDKPKDPFAWAGDQFDKKEERRSAQTLLLYLLYFALAAGFAALVFFLFNTFFS